MAGRGANSKAGDTVSVSIGGSVSGSAIVAGKNQNVALTQSMLPAPDEVDIRAEIAAIRQILMSAELPNSRRIANALEAAEIELEEAENADAEPDKAAIGGALDRALETAGHITAVDALSDNLKPHVMRAVAWLGDNWHKLLPLVGIAI